MRQSFWLMRRTLLLILLTLSAGGRAEAVGADHSAVPGVVIDHQPAASGKYVGSPSIVVLPGGDYVASHDVFGPKSTYRERALTRVFRSTDRGKTWTHLSDIHGQLWSTLFVHRGALYLMGTFARYHDVVIRRSINGGRTWTEPDDAETGRLLTGKSGGKGTVPSPLRENRDSPRGSFHCAPVPVVVHAGRLWRAMEDSTDTGRWGLPFRAFVMSAPVEADLLRAKSWTSTNRLPGDAKWLDGKFNGWLEGNAVVTPEGRVANVLRVDTPAGGVAAVVEVSGDGKSVTFDSASGFIELPGAAKKFTIRYDDETKHYWSLTSIVAPKHRGPRAGSVRNTLALMRSPDLRVWEVRCILLHHPDVAKHGFQYPDWQYDGEDLIAAVRTGYDDGLGGAHNAHDANYLTFHRVEGFRRLLMADSVVEPKRLGICVESPSDLADHAGFGEFPAIRLLLEVGRLGVR
jgi:hypothetical protein